MATVQLPPEAAGITFEQVNAELCRRSLKEFVRYGWKEMQPSVPFSDNWHIGAICEHLEAVSRGQIKKLLISIAPRHTKSWTVSVFWLPWHWGSINPATQWIFGSYGMELPTRDSVFTRRLIEGLWYRQRFGCICPKPFGKHEPWCRGYELMGDQNVKTHYDNDRGGRRLTASVEAGTTGHGGDILVLDDPIDIKKAGSAATRKAAHAYVDQVWAGRKNDPQSAAEVVIAQRTHEEDVSGHVLEQGEWEHLCLPTEYDPRSKATVTKSPDERPMCGREGSNCTTGFKDPRTKRGELLWPLRFTADVIARAKKRLLAFGFSAQHQQRPTPAQGGYFNRATWRFWHPWDAELPAIPLPYVAEDDPHDVPTHYHQGVLPAAMDEMLQSVDTSFKDEAEVVRRGEAPDPISVGMLGRKGPDVYLLDRVNRTADVLDACKVVMEQRQRFPSCTRTIIEDKANGPAMITLMRRHVPGLQPATPQGSKTARVITAVGTEDDKDARALSYAAIQQGGNCWLPHPAIAPWVWEFIEQHADFPLGAHDDDVDMMSQGVLKMQPNVWKEADVDMREARDHGNAPPITDTRELLRLKVQESLYQQNPEANPAKNRRPKRRAGGGFFNPYRR